MLFNAEALPIASAKILLCELLFQSRKGGLIAGSRFFFMMPVLPFSFRLCCELFAKPLVFDRLV